MPISMEMMKHMREQKHSCKEKSSKDENNRTKKDEMIGKFPEP
jgi:hypothetical protein